MGEKTSIRCTRCGTRTTWTPYCPGCGAYLEFAGDPPWVPAPPSAADATKAPAQEADLGADASPPRSDREPPAAPGADADAATSMDHEADAAPSPALPAPVAESPVAPPAPSKPAPSKPAQHQRPKRRIGGVNPWWRFWDRPQPEPPAVKEPPAEEAHPTPRVSAPEEPVVQAPAVPATVSSEQPARSQQDQKRTIALGRQDDLGSPDGSPCPRCRFSNIPGTVYCARCGLPLAQAATVDAAPVQPTAAPASEAPRRRDWGCLTGIVIVLVLAIIILFTPPGKPFVSGAGNIMRNVTYWVIPDVGTPVTYASIKASSTGFGNPPKSMAGDNLQTFWTSAAENDFGAGTTLSFTFQEPTTIDRMVIYPGIQNGRFSIRALATPKDLQLVFTEVAPLDGPPPSPAPSSTGPSPSSTASSVAASPSFVGEASLGDADGDGAVDTFVSASPTPNVNSPSPSPSSTSASTTATTSASPSPTPTPTATSTVNAELPLIVSQDQWTSVIQFDPVLVETVTVTLETVYPPALRDTYISGTDGQVAITNISFMPMFTLQSLFENTFRVMGGPSPSPSPSSSPTSSGASPSGTQNPSPSPDDPATSPTD